MKSSETAKQLIKESCRSLKRPDGKGYLALTYKDECTIEENTTLSLLEIEVLALESGVIPERYCRNQQTLSYTDQAKLLQSHVAIIGLGGLGGAVTEILARVGIGTLTLVDGDSFDESNLNRQLLSSIKTLGDSKAKTAAKRVTEINPAVKMRVLSHFLTTENRGNTLEDAQLAVDCLDTITARFVLAKGCREKKIPLVSAAIAGTSGQATIVFPDDGLERIYGPVKNAPKRGIESSMGTLGFTAVYMAAVECAEVVTQLLGKTSGLKDGLLLADVTDHSLELIKLPGNKL